MRTALHSLVASTHNFVAATTANVRHLLCSAVNEEMSVSMRRGSWVQRIERSVQIKVIHSFYSVLSNHIAIT
jgi:hypothetical protein